MDREQANKLDDKAVRLGTAGWTIPASCRGTVQSEGSHLERYASVLNAVEINSSFHRPHRQATYEKWASATPCEFRFAVKAPKSVTHVPGLALAEMGRFIEETSGLGEKLAIFLIQFAPGRSFDEPEAEALFEAFRKQTATALVCEPRHASWFTPAVDRWLAERLISRVAADPSRFKSAGDPGGWEGLHYYRLHGAPKTYYSAYEESYLQALSDRLAVTTIESPAWCIFDNTASGAALKNAIFLQTLLRNNK